MSMSEAKRIADQHRCAFDGEAWHGPHVFELLEGIDAKLAARKPIAGAHSIWEIVLHMRSWEEIVLRRIQGEVVEPTAVEDWPAVSETGPTAWVRALAALRQTHDDLHRAIGGLTDAALERPAPGSSTTLYRLLHGEVQHALYHAGQIAILKKD
jgi:uncharacterized damage-inducible protein DinB